MTSQESRQRSTIEIVVAGELLQVMPDPDSPSIGYVVGTNNLHDIVCIECQMRIELSDVNITDQAISGSLGMAQGRLQERINQFRFEHGSHAPRTRKAHPKKQPAQTSVLTLTAG